MTWGAAIAILLIAVLPGRATAAGVAFDSNENGDAVLMAHPFGHENRSIWLASGSTGSLGRLRRVARPPARSGDVAVNGRGDAIAAWHARSGGRWRAFAALRPAGAAFGRPVDLGPTDNEALPPQVAINAAGQVVVAWSPGHPHWLETASGSVTDGLTARETLPEYSNYWYVAIADDGEVGVAWDGNVDNRFVVKVAFRPPGGTFAAGAITGPKGSPPLGLAMAADGRALVMWERDEPDDGVEVAERPPGGAFGPPTLVSGAVPRTQFPALGMNAAGAAVVVWDGGTRRTSPELHLAARSSGPGTWSEPVTVARAHGYVFGAVRVHADGAATVAWRDQIGLTEALRRDPSGALGPAVTLVRPRLDIGALFRRPAVGVGAVAWEASNGNAIRTLTGAVGGPRLVAQRTRAWVRERPARACLPRRGRVLRTRRVSVYRYRIYGHVLAEACLLSRGKPIEIEGGARPPILDVAGPLVAYSADACDEEACWTYVSVLDLRDDEFGLNRTARARPTSRDGTTEIGSVAVRGDGAFGWIACRRTGEPEDGVVERSCRRPGGVAAVWAVASTPLAEPRLVARGRAIHPASLRLDRARLTWVEGGLRRSRKIG